MNRNLGGTIAGAYTMGVMKNHVWTRTRYISRMSVNRDASVKMRNATPSVNADSSTTEIGNIQLVAWKWKRVATRIARSGTIESTRLTRATPTADTTKTERGR